MNISIAPRVFHTHRFLWCALAAGAAAEVGLDTRGFLIAQFKTSPVGAAIVTAVGPLRHAVEQTVTAPRRYLVIAPVADGKPGAPVQIEQQVR